MNKEPAAGSSPERGGQWPGQADLAVHILVHCRGIGLDGLLRSLLTPMILGFHDFYAHGAPESLLERQSRGSQSAWLDLLVAIWDTSGH